MHAASRLSHRVPIRHHRMALLYLLNALSDSHCAAHEPCYMTNCKTSVASVRVPVKGRWTDFVSAHVGQSASFMPFSVDLVIAIPVTAPCAMLTIYSVWGDPSARANYRGYPTSLFLVQEEP